MSNLALAFNILARDRASGPITGVGNSAEESEGKLKNFAKGGATALGNLAKAAKVSAVVAGGALTKGLVDALDNEAITDAAFGGLDLAPGEFEQLGKVSSSLYRNAWGDSLEDVSDAVAGVRGELGNLGADELETLTAQSIDFAKAFKQDVGGSVGAAGLLVRNGLVRDGQEAIDVLTTAMQRVPPSVRDEVLAATNEYSTFFADLGLTGSEAFAVIADAAQEGGSFGVDKVGDALKELTIRATDMSTASKEAFWQAGLSSEDMAARFLEGGDSARGALSDLIAGLQGIDNPVDQANAAIALFGTPLEDLSVSEIPGFLDQLSSIEGGLGNVAGAAEAVSDRINANPKTKIQAFQRKVLGGLADFVGGKVIPAIEDVAPAVEQLGAILFAGDFRDGPFGEDSPIVDTFFDIREGAETIAKFVTDDLWPALQDGAEDVANILTGDVLPAIQDFGGFVKDEVVPPLVDLGTWIKDNRPVLIGLATAVGVGLTVAFTSWAASATAAAAATIAAAAPVLAIGAAIAGLTAGVIYAYQNWDWFRDSVDAVAGFLTGTVWPALQTGVSWLADRLVPAVQNVAQWVTGSLVPAISDLVSWFADRLAPIVQANVDIFVNDVLPVLQDVAGFIGDKVIPAIGDFIGFMADSATEAVDMATKIGEKVGEIVGFFTGLAEDIGGIAESLWTPLSDGFRTAINAILEAWNALDLGIHIEIPNWVPKFGGKGFHIDDVFPDIDTLHDGGTLTRNGVEPLRSDEVFIKAKYGETVYPAGSRPAGDSNTFVQNIYNPVAERPSDSVRALRKKAVSL